MKTNEEKIDEICHKEGKVLIIKEWLGVLFFVAAIVVAGVYIKALSLPVSNYVSDMERDRVAATVIIICLSAFAATITAGYFYNQLLSKKLDRLWEQKKLLF
jgi:uncharacterized membrane protein